MIPWIETTNESNTVGAASFSDKRGGNKHHVDIIRGYK